MSDERNLFGVFKFGLAVFGAIAIAALIVGRGAEAEKKNAVESVAVSAGPDGPSVSIPEDKIFTVGNHSFLPMRWPHGKVEDFLLALAEFEQRHPELEIIGWARQENSITMGRKPEDLSPGLWIDHRPRVAASQPASAIAEKGGE